MLNLGILIKTVDSDTAKRNDIVEGVYVSSIDEFSQAEKAGMKIGDIIVKCDGKLIKTKEELISMKEGKEAGDTMNLEVVRGKKNISISVILEEKTN